MLPHHKDERGQQEDQETRIHDTGDGDSLARWAFLNGWNSGSLTQDGRLVESEEDDMKESGGLLAQIGLEVGMDIDDESGADGGEQTCL